MAMLSKTQIDRLGDRLRRGSFDEADLRLLDDYRRSFGPAYEAVVQAIRERLRLEPTGRPAKSTGAIIEKLHRESIRLTQIQDIAGCRVVVPESVEQEQVVSSLCGLFSGASVIDRRVNPSYGYRAVHVVVQTSKKFVEIQIRTSLQHLWAELSEKLSDVVDRAIKYGGGAPDVRTMLARSSLTVERLEGERRSSRASRGASHVYLPKNFATSRRKECETYAKSCWIPKRYWSSSSTRRSLR